MVRITLSFLFFILFSSSFAQHIQYRDKKKPAAKTDGGSGNIPVPDNTVKVTPPNPVVVEEKKIIPKDTVAKPVAIKEDTSKNFIKTRVAFTMNPRLKKPYVEEQNMCDLMSKPEVAPTLPLVINKVTPEMVKMLKERYQGRLYSITGLNMRDERLKYKLKICDRNLGKFRSEYLDKDGKVVNDPDFDYD
ncbi:MAG: hypothetical protein JWO92_393 [Chitinophagaceae bacterium]|nr:hypothetical protein [Chitinophagaceae bacterium]